MGQCVIKDCGFNVQKFSEPQRKNLNEFLKERIKDRYGCTEGQKSLKSRSSRNFLEDQTKINSFQHEENYCISIDEDFTSKVLLPSHLESDPPCNKNKKKESENISISTRNLQKYKDLSISDSFLRNKHFFTPKSSSEEQQIKHFIKDKKNQKQSDDNLKKMEFSPKSTALQTDNNDRKNQNGFFNPMQFESPEQQTPTPTKVEFGNIFTEEDELSEASENLESFEKKFPQAIIEKYSKKSKGKI